MSMNERASLYTIPEDLRGLVERLGQGMCADNVAATMDEASRALEQQAARIAELEGRAEQAERDLAAAREALAFYRDGWTFTISRHGGLEWKPKEDLLDDCGNVARKALAQKDGSNG